VKLFDRLDNAINPIVVKELRQAVQSRLVTYGLLIFLLLQLGVLGFSLLAREARNANALDFGAGREVFRVLQAILAGSCLIFVPLYAGIRLALERGDANMDLLFISTLKPRSIITGKFVAALVLTLLIFSACAPFMTFTYLLRGLDIPSILLVLVIDLIAVLLATQFAILLAVLPLNWILKGILALLSLGLLWAVLFGTVNITNELVLGFMGVRPDTWEFWGAFLSITGLVLVGIGLMFVCAVALVKPASANRALPVRLYLVTTAAASGGLAWYWARKEATAGPLIAWLIFGVTALCGYLVVAVNEREHWGPRVLRAIPRRRLFRLPAFLLFSGSAGGISFAMVTISFMLIAFLFLVLDFSPGHGPENSLAAAATMLALALYTYNYGVAALLCRTWLFARWIKPLYTWVLGFILVGVGSAFPPLIAYLVLREDMGYRGGPQWWLLPNPFASLVEMADSWRHHGYPEQCLAFAVAWAALTTLVALPWFLPQLRRFRPPAPARA
jgi:hypothetical protein